jgi:hypothetical protein
VTDLEEINPLFQSIPAGLEQCAQLSMTEESLDLTAILLCLNKGVYFVEGS